jgi:peptidoglycan/LPS O-acetylase OafA/YrhL
MRFIGRFALRRSVRLDPPYWISILVALLFLALRTRIAGQELGISWHSIIAHLFYVQELTGSEAIQLVYWTLTYEIQFYLIYIVAFWLMCRGRAHRGWYKAVSNATIVALLVFAFIGALHIGEWAPRGIFLNYWFAFASGVLAYYGGCRGSNAALHLSAALACAMLFSAPFTREVFNSPAAITCLGLATLGRLKRMDTYFRGPVARKLGDISYSLYLIHMPALVLGISLGSRIFEPGPLGSIGIFAMAMSSALLLSLLFWNLIERPSHDLAKRIRPGRDGSRALPAQGELVHNPPG